MSLSAATADEIVRQLEPQRGLGVEVDLWLARALIEQQQYFHAIAVVEAIAAAHPREWRAWWYRGIVAAATLRHDRATSALIAVHRHLPGELAPKLALGMVAEAAGDPTTAARWYDVVARTDRAYTSAAFGLGRCLAALGRTRAGRGGICRRAGDVQRSPRRQDRRGPSAPRRCPGERSADGRRHRGQHDRRPRRSWSRTARPPRRRRPRHRRSRGRPRSGTTGGHGPRAARAPSATCAWGWRPRCAIWRAMRRAGPSGWPSSSGPTANGRSRCVESAAMTHAALSELSWECTRRRRVLRALRCARRPAARRGAPARGDRRRARRRRLRRGPRAHAQRGCGLPAGGRATARRRGLRRGVVVRRVPGGRRGGRRRPPDERSASGPTSRPVLPARMAAALHAAGEQVAALPWDDDARSDPPSCTTVAALVEDADSHHRLGR